MGKQFFHSTSEMHFSNVFRIEVRDKPTFSDAQSSACLHRIIAESLFSFLSTFLQRNHLNIYWINSKTEKTTLSDSRENFLDSEFKQSFSKYFFMLLHPSPWIYNSSHHRVYYMRSFHVATKLCVVLWEMICMKARMDANHVGPTC